MSGHGLIMLKTYYSRELISGDITEDKTILHFEPIP